MARGIERLTGLDVTRLTKPREDGEPERKPRRVHDGGGLYLQIGRKGAPDACSWVYRWFDGRDRTLGLGACPAVSLATARKIAADARDKVALAKHGLGADPIAAKHAAMEERRAAKVDAAKAMTFRQAADGYIDGHKASWRNPVHAKQWTSTLDTYAHPIIGDLPVSSVDTALVTKVLEQERAGKSLWQSRPETASRLRGRIEVILDWARVRGHRTGENPARWKGHLDHVLPASSKVKRVKHHEALAIDDMAAFMADLRAREAVAARALEFAILTCARTGEVIGATWGEIDLDGKTWTVPAGRMKAAREHRVPLADRAVEILRALPGANERKGYVFPGPGEGQPLSNMALLMLLRRMKRGQITAHGFRSTFRDWVAERTSFPSEAAEMALAHTVGDKVEAAYRRGDLFDRRRDLAEAWAAFCERRSDMAEAA